MDILSIDAVTTVDQAVNVTQELPVKPTPDNFSDLLIEGVEQVNSSLQVAETLAQDVALGKNIATHEIMIAMEQAKLDLQMAVEVRNKLLDVYQEVMRMQI